MRPKKWFPVTPAGTIVTWLSRDSEEEAWSALVEDAKHMPYNGKAGFQVRGYTVQLLPATMAEPAPAGYKFAGQWKV